MTIQRISFSRRLSVLCIAGPLFFSLNAAANEQDEAASSLWGSVKETVGDIVENGAWDLYVSGHAHHSRSTYTEKRLGKLNENTWGLGFGKTIRNEKGNEESLYALVIRDSNKNDQWSAGYAYQWIYPVAGSGLEVGAGISALLIRRHDWFDGVPFPAVLPVASIGIRQAKLMTTYVPRMSTRKGKGNVLLVFARFEW